MKRIMLYARTLRHLKPRQFAYLLIRRIFPSSKVSLPKIPVLRRNGVGMESGIARSVRGKDTHELRFLNQTQSFPNGEIDWVRGGMPRLWRYNLHYFDCLQDPAIALGQKARYIYSWIEKNPVGVEVAWEPYPVSLRIVNWIKFFLMESESLDLQDECLESLYLQAAWLEKNIEFHILANHYMKNGVALFFAGMFFQGDDAARWLRKGAEILVEELDEQFLGDGGHYERSPMYHSIAVEDYLDVLNITISSESGILKGIINIGKTKRKIAKAVRFLNDICLPDGEIPLFNDAAFGIAPRPESIFDYARRFLDYVNPTYIPGTEIIEKGESGYYGIRHDEDMLIVDCGAIGPDYQPGHAHCDCLSYELAVNGRRVIVDSGVYDYEAGPRRTYARSTRAHNTIVVDKEDQSEVWSVFRVARRAYPIEASIAKRGDGYYYFEAAHDGYKRLSGQIVHKRTIDYDGKGCWIVNDEIQGVGKHIIESFIHIHPDFTAVRNQGAIVIETKKGEQILSIIVPHDVSIKINKSLYFPGFGIEIANDLIILSESTDLPFTFGYKVVKGHQTAHH